MQSSHTDFGQTGYPQQYGFAPNLSTVAANSAHDINKQVQAGQPAMFSNSGGMPASAAQQHHQPNMAGPAPSPQPPMVQSGQQLSRAHMTAMPSFFARTTVPRTLPNMGRNTLTTVVNQTGQQPSSQYSHPVQMVPPHPSFHHHTMGPIIVNHQLPPMYTQRTYSPQQYPFISPGQVYVNSWSNFNNAPAPNSNGYYSTHPSFNTMPPQQMPQMTTQTQQKKILPIIDPETGKNILEGVSDEMGTGPPLEKKNENADPTICVQFATQVAAAIANDEKSDNLSKSSSVEDSRITDTQTVLNSSDIVLDNIHEAENRIIDTCEQYTDSHASVCTDEPVATIYEKSSDLKNNESVYENNCIPEPIESVPVTEIKDSPVYGISPEELTLDESEPIKSDVSSKQDVSALPEKIDEYFEMPEISEPTVQVLKDISNETVSEVIPQCAPPHVDDSKMQQQNGEVMDTGIPSSNKMTEKPAESKKNKTKKRKDLNKRGESKEGGEMDAFLDKGEEVTVSSSPISLTPTTAPAPVSSDQRSPSPIPITDTEYLSCIPLPGEPGQQAQNDASPSELPSDISPVSSVIENDNKENIEEPQNKIVLKYSYKEDQWSPLNPEGKKQYDRDFLLQLQSQPMSLCKPSNLPNLDVIKDKAHIQKLTEVNRQAPMSAPARSYDPFMPNYARGGPPRAPHLAVNRRSAQREKPKKIISFSSSLNQAIKLHESENAWKPAHKLETPEETAETEEMYRKVRGILNKLTPQKFETLVEQVKNLNINTEEKLNGVIDLIFEKAIDEPNFSVPYANMCKQLALIKVPVAGQPNQQVNFRKLLLTKCQKEFEQDRCDEIKREERMKAIEAADQDKKKELQIEYEELEKKMRYRQLGNIRFIGELFKLGMLIEPIMHECIRKLLSQGDEESLECLCKLLKTIGKELEEGKGKGRESNSQMDAYFAEMQRIVDKRLTSSRVRFMLQDVIDLKKLHNWIPRREDNNPKTIDQIHKEAEKEREQQAYQNMNFPKRMPDERDRRKGGRNIGPSEDGWTPSSKGSKGSYNTVDPSKLKLTKPDEVESIRLGPGGKGMQSWGRGSSGGNKTAMPDSDVKTTLTNRYSALADQSLGSVYENRRGSQRSAASSRESSRGRNNQLPPAIRKTPSTSKERENLIETVKGMSRAAPPEPKVQEMKPPETQINGKATDSPALSLKGPELSEEEIEKKTKPLIDEFLHNVDFEEAIKCITELASPTTVHLFIDSAINQVLERSSQARYSLGQLLCSLVKKKLITFEQYKKGFSTVLENVDDFSLDIPLIWDYMGEILEPMLEEKWPLTFLKDILEPCIPSQTAGKLVSAVLHCAAKKKGTIKLGELWRESGLQWTDFLASGADVSEFVRTHKLDFTISPTKVSPKEEMSTDEIKKNLKTILEETNELEKIFDWIDANVPQEKTTEPSFIRALVTAVHENAITGSDQSYELSQTRLKQWVPLLTRYIDHNENLELQALYALQSLTNQLNQPKGILSQIFDILYDDDVISEETFKRWEQSDDPNELEGKGVAVLSVTSFFTWLREAEYGDSDE